MHYAKRIYTYSEDFFVTAFFSLKARGFSTTVLVVCGGVTPAGCEVPATAMVTILSEVVDGSVPAVSAASSARTSSPANSVLVTFWRLGSGGEAEGLQNRQCKHATTLLFDNSTGQQLHTWGVRLHALYVCALPDDPEGPLAKLRPTPRMIRGSCSSLLSLRFPFPPGAPAFGRLTTGQSISCLSLFRFSRGAGKKVAFVAAVVVWAPQIAIMAPREPLPHLLLLLGPIVHHITKARNGLQPVPPEISVYARVGDAVVKAVDDVLL
jgi:hypothetical protein